MSQGIKYKTEEERREARRESSKRWRQSADRSEYYRNYQANMTDEQKARRADRMKSRREVDGDKLRQQSRESYHRNKHKHKKTREYSMWQNAKIRAQKKSVTFDITPQDIIIPLCCPVLGITLSLSNTIVSDDSPSLDRIKPELGYVKGNICVISNRANSIKSYGTAEEHLRVAEYIKSFS